MTTILEASRVTDRGIRWDSHGASGIRGSHACLVAAAVLQCAARRLSRHNEPYYYSVRTAEGLREEERARTGRE